MTDPPVVYQRTKSNVPSVTPKDHMLQPPVTKRNYLKMKKITRENLTTLEEITPEKEADLTTKNKIKKIGREGAQGTRLPNTPGTNHLKEQGTHPVVYSSS